METYDTPAHLSHSQISMLLPTREGSCQLQYSFRYRYHLPEAEGVGLVCGSALDEGLNALLARSLFGSEPDLNEGLDAMRKRMAESEIPDQEAETKALETAMLLFWESHKTWRGQDVQRSFLAEIDGVSVKGIIDRIDADGTIVDHKLTRSQKWQTDHFEEGWAARGRHQLALYLACLNALDGTERTRARLEVCYVTGRLKTPQWHSEDFEISAEEQDRELEDVRSAALIQRSGHYQASPGRQCDYCSFRPQCGAVMAMLSLDVGQISEALELAS